MKKIIVLFVLTLSLATTVFAQVRKVPAEVTEALKAKYPAAQNVEWKDKITFFQAGFNANGAEMTAEFNSKGEWLQSEKKISFEGLPDAVKDGFKKSKYTDWTTGSVTQVETKDKGTEYKIYIEKSSIVQKKFLYFNSQGQLQKETPGI